MKPQIHNIIMTNNFDSRGYDLDYYNLFLRNYLSEHRFPEADDDTFIATSEKAMAALYEGLEISAYDFVCEILMDEFTDQISLEEESIEFWTYTFLEELAPEFKGIELSNEWLDTSEGAVFRLIIIGRITLFFEKYGL